MRPGLASFIELACEASPKVIALALGVFMGACSAIETTVEQDIHGTGGVVGHYGDYVLPAPTKEMQIYRAAFAFAFLSRMGAVTIKDPDEARAFYWYMSAINTDLNRLGGHLTAHPNCSSISAQQDCRQLFESDLPSLEAHLFDLAVQSLPNDQLKSVWNDLTSGSYWSAIIGLTDTASTEVLALHGGASVYRSEQEILVQVIVASGGPAYSHDGTTEAAQYIDAFAKGQRGDANPFAGVKPPNGSIFALFDIVQDACKTIEPIANATATGAVPRISCKMSYAPASTNSYQLDP